MSNNKLVILIGSPGSGKGTQSLLLAEKKKMTHLEASKILEKRFLGAKEDEVIKIEGDKYSLKEQEKRWRKGLLCEDAFVTHVIKESLEKICDKSEVVLLDGYPRTVKQAQLAAPLFVSLYGAENILTVFLEVDQEEVIKRNTNRKVCSLMRHSIVDLPETRDLTVCPIDGSTLEKRVMDDPETIKVRLKEFREKTFPVIENLSSQGIKVSRVDGVGTINDVLFRILKEVEEFGV